MVQNLLQDVIKNPTVRRTELAITYFNCRQKNGQSVQAFSDFLKNLEDRMDNAPFEDGSSKVDFYFATHNSCAGLYQSHFITNRKRYRVVPELHQSHFINPIYIPISNRFKIKAKRKGRSSRQARIHFYSKKW